MFSTGYSRDGATFLGTMYGTGNRLKSGFPPRIHLKLCRGP